MQRSHENTSQLLERYRDHDVVCIQEIYWGRIKQVASTSSKKGDLYEETVSHQNFVCYSTSKDSRVATYVNRKWRSSSPFVVAGRIAHKDTLLVMFNTVDGPFAVLNVYNDSEKHEAVSHLLSISQLLPPISMMCGDFNLSHPSWDKGTRDRSEHPSHGAKAMELLDLAAELQLLLANSESRPPTWESHN